MAFAAPREASAERHPCTPRCRGASTPIPTSTRAELERFYFNRWICAGRADQIPNAGDYFTRALADESVIVTRDAIGRDSRAVQRLPPSRHAARASRPRGISSIASSVRITPGPTTSTDACSPRRTWRRISTRRTIRCTAPAARSGTATSSCTWADRCGRDADAAGLATSRASSPICPSASRRGAWQTSVSAGASSTT